MNKSRVHKPRSLRVAVATCITLAMIAAGCSKDKADSTDGAATTEVEATEGAEATEAPAATDAAPATEGGAAATEAAAPVTEAGAAAAAVSGEPVKIMTVTTLNAAGPTYKNIANTAMAYEKYINSRGGIAGRPLKVTVCDEQFDPAVATTCARQAVEEGMVSIVGSFTYFAESIVPVISESDITWFGAVLPNYPLRVNK